MTTDDKKPGNSGKPGFRKGPRDGGKPAFGKPSGGKPFGAKPFAGGSKKPYSPRPAEAGEAPAGERPARAGKPYSGKPDHAKPYAGKKPYSGRPAEGAERPAFEKREGSERPFAGKPDRPYSGRPSGENTDRPKKPYSPRPAEGGERSFADKPRAPYSGKPEYAKKPYSPRPASAEGPQKDNSKPDGGERPFRDKPRSVEMRKQSERSFGERQRESAKPEGGERSFGDRPRGKPFAGKSFGSKSHGGSADGAPPRRSYGMKSHDGFAPRPLSAERERTPYEPAERIAKRLARAGISSRRDAEELIAAGRVRVNGVVLNSPALNVRMSDRIELDGKLIPEVERTRLFLFNKPAGLVTTNKDPEGRKTIFDVLPTDLPRVITIGRLDINTEGLLLLTNDGGLARTLELPATGWLRRYRVRVHGKVDQAALAALKDGIAVDGVFYGSIEASLEREQASNAWLVIGLREGKNREVKNVMGALGLEVTRLIRISYGPFQLGEMADGEVRELKGRHLRDQLGERLIEESGANFEAGVSRPFGAGSRDAKPAAPEYVKPPIPKTRDGWISSSPPERKKKRPVSREDALGRLSTSPREDAPRKERPARADGDKPRPYGDRPSGERPQKGRPREEAAPEPQRGRSANVWMAPGARPGRKPAGKTEGGKPGGDKPAGSKPFAAKPYGAKPGGKPGFKPGGKPGGGNADRRR